MAETKNNNISSNTNLWQLWQPRRQRPFFHWRRVSTQWRSSFGDETKRAQKYPFTVRSTMRHALNHSYCRRQRIQLGRRKIFKDFFFFTQDDVYIERAFDWKATFCGHKAIADYWKCQICGKQFNIAFCHVELETMPINLLPLSKGWRNLTIFNGSHSASSLQWNVISQIAKTPHPSCCLRSRRSECLVHRQSFWFWTSQGTTHGFV